jgi:asparagine synthase (glutamine-hydrolysing)
MCGIHGLLQLDGQPIADRTLLTRMGGVTSHRGPDDEGTYYDGEVALGMRRLSIIDLAGGHQPIPNEDESLWVVCNGEIYNFKQLRAELIKLGHRFRTGSDTEVIVHAYEQYGDDFVGRLDGMFGLALWDARRRRLLVARDPIGIKPLYYRHDQRRLIFASEAKAILALQAAARAIDPAALGEYLALGYVPQPASMFAGIRKLAPAHLLIVERGVVSQRRYWQLPRAIDRHSSATDFVAQVRGRIEAAVAEQMVSDVPLGAFLSGGIDSSCVVAFMARHSTQAVRTYSIGFAGSSGAQLYNELPYARQVAQLFKTEHREIVVQPDVVQLLPKLLWHLDEPMADAAFVTTYLVSEFARREVTVILSGVGGDELFGGYRRYQDEFYRARYRHLPQWLRRDVLGKLARYLPSDRHSRWKNVARLARSFMLADALPFEERYRAFVETFTQEQRAALVGAGAGEARALRAAFSQAPDEDSIAQLMHVDFATQLPDDLLMLTDKMSMATSLECRVPLLDRQLVELAASIPGAMKMRGGELKGLLKRALADVLPREILYRQKRGFGAPMGAWIRAELAPLLAHVLSRRSIEARGWLQWQPIEAAIAQHKSGRADNTDHLLSLLNLELWARLYLDNTPVADLAEELQERVAA